MPSRSKNNVKKLHWASTLTWKQKLNSIRPDGNLIRPQAESDLARWVACFTETQNPAAAWLCWHLANKWRLPVPDVVADEIDRFSEGVAELAVEALIDKKKAISPDIIGELWAPPKKPGKGATRRGERLGEQLHVWNNDLEIAERVHELRTTGHRMSHQDAVAEVANENEMSWENVKRIAGKRRRMLVARDEDMESDRSANEAQLWMMNEQANAENTLGLKAQAPIRDNDVKRMSEARRRLLLGYDKDATSDRAAREAQPPIEPAKGKSPPETRVTKRPSSRPRVK